MNTNLSRFQFKRLQTRLLISLLLPVLVMVLLGGVAGFWYARGIMLDQWQESAVVRLQRAAHYIEMRLLKPVDLLNVLFQVSDRNAAVVSPEQVVDFLIVMDGWYLRCTSRLIRLRRARSLIPEGWSAWDPWTG